MRNIVSVVVDVLGMERRTIINKSKQRHSHKAGNLARLNASFFAPHKAIPVRATPYLRDSKKSAASLYIYREVLPQALIYMSLFSI